MTSVKTPSECSADAIGELETMVAETEETLQSLRAELQRCRERRQHSAIEQLDLRFAEARPKWVEVRDFLRQALEELRK